MVERATTSDFTLGPETMEELLEILPVSSPLYDARDCAEELDDAVVDIFERLLVSVARRNKDQNFVVCRGSPYGGTEFDSVVGKAFLSRLGIPQLSYKHDAPDFLERFSARLLAWTASGGTIQGTTWTLKYYGTVEVVLVPEAV